MNDLLAALFSWAVTLSGYPMPDQAPLLIEVNHQWLVDNACNGYECKVMGWFPPGNAIYIDERLDPENKMLHASIIVHEYVHYLQHVYASTEFTNCENAIRLERQAYYVQQEFLVRNGIYQPVGASMHKVGC